MSSRYSLLTVSQMAKLPTHRLLAYKKKLHKKGPHYEHDYQYGCGCRDCLQVQKAVEEVESIIEAAKTILKSREHVKKKHVA